MSVTHIQQQVESARADDWSLSIVVPVFNEAPCIAPLVSSLRDALSGITERWEILFVDDHSNDDTLVNIRSQSDRDPRVHWVRLARRHGQHTALACGMDLATGDAIVTMDADLQHPPAHLPTMIERWRQGYDVVNMVKARSGLRGFGTVIEAVCASLFYGLFNLLSPIKVTPGIAEYRLLDRSCIVALSKVPERYRYPKGVIPQLDFRQVQIEFQCEPRQHGDSGYTLGRRVAVASGPCCVQLVATLWRIGTRRFVTPIRCAVGLPCFQRGLRHRAQSILARPLTRRRMCAGGFAGLGYRSPRPICHRPQSQRTASEGLGLVTRHHPFTRGNRWPCTLR